MKFLKTYEGFTLFNKGDYVLLNVEDISSDLDKNFGGDKEQLKDSYAIVKEFDPQNNENYPYKVQFYDGSVMNIGYYEIERLLTHDEKEEFEMKKNSNIYNL